MSTKALLMRTSPQTPKGIVSLSFEYYEKTERDIFVYELEIDKPLILLDNALVQTFTMFEKRDDNYFLFIKTEIKCLNPLKISRKAKNYINKAGVLAERRKRENISK